MLQYKEGISLHEYSMMRGLVGWQSVIDEQAEISIANSALVLSCRDENENLIGVIRVLWDGGYSAYIADLIVIEEYRGQGIGTELMTRAMAFLRGKLKNGWKMMVTLVAAVGKEPFYERFGFISRPTPEHGAGMSQLLTFMGNNESTPEDVSQKSSEKEN